MKRKGMGGHESQAAKTDEWLTPKPIIEALGGYASFDLDPCAPAIQPWPTAQRKYTISDNGLLLPWAGRVWLNPPYSQPKLNRFLGRLVAHGKGCALIFARTETETFDRFVWQAAHGVLFLKGRLTFHLPDGTPADANAGAPSILAAYGPQELARLAECGLPGQLVPLILPRLWIIGGLEPTWLDVIREAIGDRAVIRVEDVYRAVAAHPKARHNRNLRAKVRQTMARGGFRRIAPGLFAV